MLAAPKTEIQSTSLSAIAKFAAKEAAKKHNRTVLVEDSGLFVKALDGFPGPFSSYVHDTIGVEGLLRLMTRQTRREAYFSGFVSRVLGKSERDNIAQSCWKAGLWV